MSGGRPWRHWYHCIGNTYGTWLPGDERGFRDRRRRRHREGDYKHPPLAGRDAALRIWARRRLRGEPVLLSEPARAVGCQAWVEALHHYGAEVAAFSLGAMHWHLLVRCTPIDQPLTWPDPEPRRIIGRAKSWATRRLREEGYFLCREAGLWGRRGRVMPIRDRAHQVNVALYIRRHVEQGAAIFPTSPRL